MQDSLQLMFLLVAIGLTVVALARIPQLSVYGEKQCNNESVVPVVPVAEAELVWWYGWLTCASTALGMLPILFFQSTAASLKTSKSDDPDQVSSVVSRVPIIPPSQSAHGAIPDLARQRRVITSSEGDEVGRGRRMSCSGARSVSRLRSEPRASAPSVPSRRSPRQRNLSASIITKSEQTVQHARPTTATSTQPLIVSTAMIAATPIADGSNGTGSSSISLSTLNADSKSDTGTRGVASASWVAVANAIAGGMMLAASAALSCEGAMHSTSSIGVDGNGTAGAGGWAATLLTALRDAHASGGVLHVAAGIACGLAFVLLAERFLGQYEHLKVDGLFGLQTTAAQQPLQGPANLPALSDDRMLGLRRPRGESAVQVSPAQSAACSTLAAIAHASAPEPNKEAPATAPGSDAGSSSSQARRLLLIVAVMTVHSLAEGIGLGVAFGSGRAAFGPFISAALAVHNIPEGLMVASQLMSRGAPPLATALWCIATSLPQPLMAVPAFLATHAFEAVLPLGLGFAAGSMAWVALRELLPEAVAELGARRALPLAGASALAMLALQALLK